MAYKKDTYMRFIMSDIQAEQKDTIIENYASDIAKETLVTFHDEKEIYDYFSDINEKFKEETNVEDKNNFRYYTGSSYTKVNELLRGIWDYEINGQLTKETKDSYQQMAIQMEKSLNKVSELPSNIVTYRGTNLKTFAPYNIKSLDDLKSLEGNYIYDNGFVSTSLLKSVCMFQKETSYFGKYNILVKYIIPRESKEGIPIFNSYYTDESEYLINRGSLVKVMDTTITNGCAYITCILIPRKLWSKDYNHQMELENEITRH